MAEDGERVTALEVVADIVGAIALPNGPIALDALLMAAVAVRDGLPHLSVIGVREAKPLDIPIALSPCGRVYLASLGHAEVEERELRWINRKFPIGEAQGMAEPKFKRINISAGAQKSYRLPLETQHLADGRMTWWADGDAAGVRELLQCITYLGKRRAVGLGRVRSWTVTECEPWPGFPVLRGGVPLRQLPRDWAGLVDYDLAYRVLTPPYWDHVRQEECAVPLEAT